MSSIAPLVFVLAASAAQPDIYFITMDTIRADRLGFYGFGYNTTPNLDALAEEARVFDNAICEVPLTGPSFGSVLSSRYPRLTGMTRNGIRMPDHVPLIQEQFQDAGYETVCVQSNWTLKADLSGLNRGFDFYEDTFKQRRWIFFTTERDADDVTSIALDILSKRDPDKPLFAWFHYSDPHAPYESHRRFDVAREFDHDERRVEKVNERYASEIAFTDDQIGRLLEAIPKENTYIVFFGDHGESLYEHDYLGHGRHVYQPGLHIPLFVYGPGIEPGRDAREVRGIDVGPTLLSLAGIEPAESMMGRELNGMWEASLRPRVIETYGGAVIDLPGIRSLMEDDPPQRQAVLYGEWKLILGEGEPLLFNLKADPQELENVAADHQQTVLELRAMIEEWSAKYPQSADAEAVELTDEDVDALRTLGYIE